MVGRLLMLLNTILDDDRKMRKFELVRGLSRTTLTGEDEKSQLLWSERASQHSETFIYLFILFITRSPTGNTPLTHAPLGYSYTALHWEGYFEPPPPLISETPGPILKIQAAFDSPRKNF